MAAKKKAVTKKAKAKRAVVTKSLDVETWAVVGSTDECVILAMSVTEAKLHAAMVLEMGASSARIYRVRITEVTK
jgi:hypothetical protein